MPTPVNPVVGAQEAFLTIFNNLPTAVISYVYLALFLVVVVFILRLVFRFRG